MGVGIIPLRECVCTTCEARAGCGNAPGGHRAPQHEHRRSKCIVTKHFEIRSRGFQVEPRDLMESPTPPTGLTDPGPRCHTQQYKNVQQKLPWGFGRHMAGDPVVGARVTTLLAGPTLCFGTFAGGKKKTRRTRFKLLGGTAHVRLPLT